VLAPDSQGDCGKLPMLTDIFARRYEQPRMWETFYEESRRLLVQGWQLLNDLCPYYVDGKENERGKDFWTQIHDLLARELGLKELSPQYWGFYNKQDQWQSGRYTAVQMCETWMLGPFDGKISADRFIKERLSLVEIGFREHENFVAGLNAQLAERIKSAELFDRLPKHPGSQTFSNTAGTIRAANVSLNAKFQTAVNELNARFRQAASCITTTALFKSLRTKRSRRRLRRLFGGWWRSRSGTTSIRT
jgi:AbiJ N-terminal domain 4